MSQFECTGKTFGSIPLFDPAEGIVVRSPVRQEPGWWVGAPGATYDSETNTFYLVYRYRQPRDLGRGVECRIAESHNGVTFQDIWALPKTSICSASIEKCALVRSASDRLWRLYVSYVASEDGRWRIGMMVSEEPDGFDACTMTDVLTPDNTLTDGVKDPNLFTLGPVLYMLVSYGCRLDLPAEEAAVRHDTGDIFNTGLTLSRTGAAVSLDGEQFQWLGDVSPVHTWDVYREEPPAAWDHYCRRIGALLPLQTGGYLAFYDGSNDVSQNYEERTGLALTYDMRNFTSASPFGPALTSPYGTGSLRYIDAVTVGHETFYYYEIAMEDGSHEMRVSVCERI